MRLRRFLRRLRAVARKELMHIRRDLTTLYFALGMPVLLLALFGYAVTFDVDHVPTLIVDQDATAESRSLAAHLFSGPTFRDAGRRDDAAAVERAFRRGDARAALVIPLGYAESLARGDSVDVQLLLDAADNQTAGNVLSYAGRFAVTTNERLVREAGATPPPRVEARVRALYNPGLRSTLFLIPGLIAVIQSMMAVLLTALTLAREWERGSMEQLFATPVGRLEIVLGKLLPYFGVALGQLLLVLVAAVLLFELPIRGSLLLLFGVSSLFLLAMLAQGLLISVVTRNQMVATQVAALSSMLPAMLLSGFMLPIDNMPVVLQGITHILGARWFVHASRALILRGAGWESIAGDALALAIIAAVLLAACVARFKRRVA